MAHDRELPTVEDESRPYWKAAADGTLLIKQCNACGAVHHYPRPFCPTCWSEDVVWHECSGKGTVYTYSTIFRNDLPPFDAWGAYIAAVVQLEEGPRLMTNIIDCPQTPEALVLDMPLEVAFTKMDDDITLALFRPAKGA